ncbi:hypothetical protein [Singulisphaera acidiphila]|uniref:DUF5666 domain-containing protein n=1 Tax=Singulisphaera acidiphila (strain ATCC BAA-1392 / DSM 18658 / VKM B-2454 / MOB10) TaxID=886293 RepID=L0D6Y9_SINAD|nr:hypothetical protein [Singulisphaera acidiphila]AGA24603.1 hypothetical protein Sinac_0145 [Singulisphaera acidiphila DSM 18658]
MNNRRTFLLALLSGVVALGLVAGSALADELLGVISKVDVEGKKVTVIENGSDKEVEVTVKSDTEFVNAKGAAAPIDLEKVSKNVAKVQEKGRKGINVVVTHDKSVASKITVSVKKKSN